MMNRFGYFLKLTGLKDFIDHCVSDAKGEDVYLSKEQAIQIKNYLDTIENLLAAKKYQQVEEPLNALNDYLHKIQGLQFIKSPESNDFLITRLSQYHQGVLRFLSERSGEVTDRLAWDTSIPQSMRQRAYKAACDMKHSGYIKQGKDTVYELGMLGMFTSDHLIARLKNEFEGDVNVVDLGTGIGTFVTENNAKQNKEKQKAIFWGVEAENDLEIKDEHITRGDIENLSALIYTKNFPKKEIHAFISRYVFNFLFNPLSALSDAYANVCEGGYVCINHLKLHGLTSKEGNDLFQYLKKRGYEIEFGNDSKMDEWCGWVLIKKNKETSLDFPLQYAGVMNSFLCMGRNLYPQLVVQYRPNVKFLRFQAGQEVMPCIRFNKYIETTSFFRKAASPDITRLRRYSDRAYVTKSDIQAVLGADRLKLFNSTEQRDKTNTDKVVCSLRSWFE